MAKNNNKLHIKLLGIDTYKEAIIYIQKNSPVCRSEGFELHTRVNVSLNGKKILATLNIMDNDLLAENEVSLSKYACQLLQAKEGDIVELSHPKPLQSLSSVRSKIYGHNLSAHEIDNIVKDIAHGQYSDIHIASFLTACAGNRLNQTEIIQLTRSMITVGQKLSWSSDIIVDKHCVGGLPGNRTTPIIVPIVTAFGLTMPKTSSRAITSPAGTADTMETLTSVNLNLSKLKNVVQKELGCIVWGGAVTLSPADDILIRVSRALNIDSRGQLIASVLSKKIAAGSTHIVIDIPVGPTAKVRSYKTAKEIEQSFKSVSSALGIHIKTIISDGLQPIGRGIGPALEANDLLAVLQNKPNAPQDLQQKSIMLAGAIIEFSPQVKEGEGQMIANEILESGLAWQKFQAICQAQGGLSEPPVAPYVHQIRAQYRGRVIAIDNRQLARLAKLAGAPHDKAAGIILYTPLESLVEKDQILYSVHASAKGELNYAVSVLNQLPDIIQVEACQ